jgi:putative glutamine amidotransferase
MQLVALADGARLLQHLPDDRPGSRAHSGGVEHEVSVVPGTRLARQTGETRKTVVSRHHQALDRVPAPWRVCAVDDEGLVEAIEHEERAFALGVQWHPELAPEGSPHDRIFRALVGAAALRAARAAVPSMAR